MSGIEGQLRRKLPARTSDVRQPLAMKAIAEKSVHAVVNQIADEGLRRSIRLDQPETVVRGFARPQIDDAQGYRPKCHPFAVANGAIRKGAPLRPFVAEHRPQDGFLREIISFNRITDPLD